MTSIDLFTDYFMGIIASSLCVLIIYFLRKKFFDAGILSLKGLIFVYGICMLRALIPLELPFAVSVRCQLLMPIENFLFFSPITLMGRVLSGWQIVASLYLEIVALFMIRLGYKYFKAYKSIQIAHVITNEYPNMLLKKIMCEENYTSHIKLLSSDIDSPISISLFKPSIILPNNYSRIYSTNELYYILKHEFIHIARRDSIKKLMINITSCFLFWNPCIKLLKKDYIQSIELRSDNEVVSKLSPSEKGEYLSTMLTVLKHKAPANNQNNTYELALGFLSNKSEYIKERFYIVSKHRQDSFNKSNIAIPFIVTAIVFSSYTFILHAHYEPPIEDIIESPDDHELDLDTDYIIVTSDGASKLYLKDGTQIPVDKEFLDTFITIGGKVIYK